MTYNKVDNNQKKVVAELRKMGYSVKSISDVKKACDLIVSKGGKVKLIELKNPEICKKKDQLGRYKYLTAGEKTFYSDFPVFIAVSAEEIDALFRNELTTEDLKQIDKWV